MSTYSRAARRCEDDSGAINGAYLESNLENGIGQDFVQQSGPDALHINLLLPGRWAFVAFLLSRLEIVERSALVYEGRYEDEDRSQYS
ncbi:hypothetical protein J3R83DRAFT_12691 [Lanmaoa asiatica]|nr:hypothetical protein J3R83DRAFT_12691 [Lanmaoa asiatica]